ncbi:MAG: DUF192 domain-containing protein [Granulosicoccus sp.]
MNNKVVNTEKTHAVGMNTQAGAANDPPVTGSAAGACKRRTQNHWPTLSAVKGLGAATSAATKTGRAKREIAGKICRAGAPLLSTYIANTSLSRLRGLFALPPLTATQALIIHPCSAVHTFGFKHVIDVAFVDESGFILRCVEMSPHSVRLCWGSRSVVEMASGTLQRLDLQVGQQLDIHLTGDEDE